MKIFDCKQRSTEWHQLRCGIPTASSMDELVTPEFKVRDGERPRNYTYAKLAEKVAGYSPESLSTFAMNQGVIAEGEAVGYFELTTRIKVREVGFCLSDDTRIGCSPDGIIEDPKGVYSGIEVKVPSLHTQIEYLCADTIPKKYAVQVQASMYVCGVDNWWFLSYTRFVPPLLVHVHRDPRAQEAITQALDIFWGRFAEAEAKLMPKIQIQQRGRD